MEVLQIFGFWDQETDSRFTNHEPLIPTLVMNKNQRMGQWLISVLLLKMELLTVTVLWESDLTCPDHDSNNAKTGVKCCRNWGKTLQYYYSRN